MPVVLRDIEDAVGGVGRVRGVMEEAGALLRSVQQERDRAVREAVRLRKQVATVDAERNHLQKENTSLRATLTSTRQASDAQTSAIEAAESRTEELLAQNAALHDNVRTQGEALLRCKRLHDEHATQRAECKALTERLIAQQDALRRDLNEIVTLNKGKEDAAEEALRSAQNNLAAEEKGAHRVVEMAATIDSLKLQHAEIVASRDATLSEVTTLTAQNEGLHEEITALHGKLDEAELALISAASVAQNFAQNVPIPESVLPECCDASCSVDTYAAAELCAGVRLREAEEGLVRAHSAMGKLAGQVAGLTEELATAVEAAKEEGGPSSEVNNLQVRIERCEQFCEAAALAHREVSTRLQKEQDAHSAVDADLTSEKLKTHDLGNRIAELESRNLALSTRSATPQLVRPHTSKDLPAPHQLLFSTPREGVVAPNVPQNSPETKRRRIQGIRKG